MASFVIYKAPNGDDIKLKLTSERAVELEERFDASISDKLKELDKLSVAAEILAAAIPEEDYRKRKQTALAIYDDMIEDGKNMRDYLMLIYNVLAAAGFIDGRAVERQREAQEAQERLAEVVHQKEIALMNQKIEEIPNIGASQS